MIATILFFILLVAVLYAVSRHERDVQVAKRQGWSKYDSLNRYSEDIKTKVPPLHSESGIKLPFNPKEPSPT